MVVVLQWYYDDRDYPAIIPKLTCVYGPFDDREKAKLWVKSASTWGGWGEYRYQIEYLHAPQMKEINNE